MTISILTILWVSFLGACIFTFFYERYQPKIEKKKWDNMKFKKDNIEMKKEKEDIVKNKQKNHDEIARDKEIKRREKLLEQLLEKLNDYNRNNNNNKQLGKRLIDNDESSSSSSSKTSKSHIESETEKIIREQDIEYYKSLETDQLLKLVQENEKKNKIEEIKRKKQERINRIKDLKLNLKSEPIVSSTISETDIIKLMFKLPNGLNLQRKFLKNDKIKDIYDFIDSNGIIDQDDEETTKNNTKTIPTNYDLSTNYPKVIYKNNDETVLNSTFEKLNITNLTTFYIIEN